MTIKIGDRSYSTRKPKDLDAALEQVTGCNAAEIARVLAGFPSPGQVAAALLPFLPDDAPAAQDLAVEIANDPDVLGAVRKLYADAAAAPAAAKGE